VLTIDHVKAGAIGAKADLIRPLLVIDIGAQLTEVAVLGYGSVIQACRVLLGTGDLGSGTKSADLVDAVVEMVTNLLRHDCAALVVDALDRGPLLVGGGAVRPEITYQLAKQLGSPVQPAPAPWTAAVRGAGASALAAHRHPGFL
jgi:rod shape-determining protein MreB